MGFHRLQFQTVNRGRIVLPTHLLDNESIDPLIDFAEQHGHDTAQWDPHKKGGLKREFFRQVFTAPANDIKNPLKDITWTPFKNALRDESSLFDYPWSVFSRRIKAGLLHAVLDDENKPIVTINLISKLKGQLYQELGLSDLSPDEAPQAFETGAGWSDKRLRNMGVYSQLRQIVLDEAQVKGRLLFSQSKGEGASFVNMQDGYTLVNWNDFPFSASLMGWVATEKQCEKNLALKDKFLLAAGKVIDLPKCGLYTNGTIFTKTPEGAPANPDFIANHDWNAYHHLWVNDLDKLNRFEKNIRHALNIDDDILPTNPVFQYALENWRTHVARELFNDKAIIGSNPDLEKRWKEFIDTPTPTRS